MTLPRHTLLRGAAVFVTVVFIIINGGRAPFSVPWDTFVYSLAFSHYYMSLLYSGRQLKQAAAAPHSLWKLAGLLAAGGAVYFYRYSLVIYFGLHHALNEVYLLDKVTARTAEGAIRRLRATGAVLSFSTYLFLLRHHKELQFIPRAALAAVLALSYGFFIFYLIKSRPLMTRDEFIDNCAAEIVSLAAIAASFFVTIRFLYIVAYHFVFWALRPLPKLMASDRAALGRYALLTAVLFAGAYLISPLGLNKYEMKDSLFFNQFQFWSYFHITLSFAISDAHPGWISRFFRKPIRLDSKVD